MFNAHPLFYTYHYYENRIYFNTDGVITFAFLIAGLCVGLPALVWVIYQHCKNSLQPSAFIILLLLNDLIELLLTVLLVFLFFYFKILIFFVIFRINGMYLHQLVALESILSYKHKNFSDFFCSTPCSIILCILLFLTVTGCQYVDLNGWLIINIVLCILPFCILAVTCTLTCKAPPPTGPKPGSAVLIVATLTLFAFTVQAVAALIILHPIPIYLLSPFLVSLRVISDPLLCVLVCKEKLRAQTQQTHAELNTEHQSV